MESRSLRQDVLPGTYEMEFYYIRSLDDLEKGTFGVLEPKHQQCKLVTDFNTWLLYCTGTVL